MFDALPSPVVSATVIPFRKMSERDRHTVDAILLYKACVLRTTQSWIKETSEQRLGVGDIYETSGAEFEHAVEFLIAFSG